MNITAAVCVRSGFQEHANMINGSHCIAFSIEIHETILTFGNRQDWTVELHLRQSLPVLAPGIFI